MKITFFSSVVGLSETFPIVEAQHCLPHWVKQARAEYINSNKADINIMRCPGIVDILRTGYVVKAWHDTHIRSTATGLETTVPDSDLQDLLGRPVVEVQSGDGIAKHLPKRPWSNRHILKINTPWHINSKVSFLMMPIPYGEDLEFESCPGILDPSISSEINVQGYVNGTGQLVIKAGTPLALLVPLTEKTTTTVVRDANASDTLWLKKRKYLNHISFVFNRRILQNAYHRHFN